MRLKKNECAIVIDENGGIVSLSIPKNIAKHDCVSDGMMVAMAILQLAKKKNKVFTELIQKEVKAVLEGRKTMTRPSEVRSDALLAAAFADYWHGKWPNQTQEVKRLELSAHYRGCRDAFYAGAKAANTSREAR